MSAVWYCTRQRAGPLVKECRALRPPLGPSGTRQDATDKRQILKGPHSAVTRTQVDRLELRLAMFGYEGSHYTLTYDWEHLPKDWDAVRRYFRAFRARAQRWRKGADYVSGAEPKELDISMTVQTLPGAEQEAVTAAVKAAVAAYLKGIAFAQDYVSYARINAAVLEADGVQDVSGLTVNGATANVAIGERQVAVLGEVSIQYGAGA